MTKTMIGRVCFVAALAATVAFAQQNETRGCESGSNGDRRAASHAVVFWDEVAGHSIAELGGRGNALTSVEIAIVHTAVYDAVNAVCGYRFTPYTVTPEVRRPALPEAAVAAAAHDVLVALYPGQQEELDRKYAKFLEVIPGHHRAKLNGVAAGRQAPAGILDLRPNDGLDAARLFAMLSTASSDAFIGCWDSKFTYAFWRPVPAIRAGGGNPSLEPDPDWIGLVITPNHPEYPAAHGCVSGAIVTTLQAYFGTDELSFTMSSVAPGLIQPVRQYNSFIQALEDILNARIYGGMHYRNSTAHGSGLGPPVPRQMGENFFPPQ